ncbi:MAG: hypothetical protein ACOC5K_03865 [Chloroflexota bacterium]
MNADAEEEQEDWSPELAPEPVVPQELRDDGSYTPHGYLCRHCGYQTRKRGFPGKQALRAHTKKHTRERRAFWRPFARQAAISAIVVPALLLGSFSPAGVPGLGLVWTAPVSEHTVGWILASAAAAIGAALMLALEEADKTLSKGAIRLAGLLRVSANVLAAGACAMLAGLLAPAPPSWSAAPVVLLLGLLPLAAGQVQVNRLSVRRGMWRSRHYMGILKPASEEAQDKFKDWLRDLSNSVRSGSVDPEKLNGPSREALRWLAARRRRRK